MPSHNKRQRTSSNTYTHINNAHTNTAKDKEILRLKQLLGEVSAERDQLKKENLNLKCTNTSLKKELISVKLSIIARDDKVAFAQDKVAEVEQEKEALEAKNLKCRSYIKKLKTDVEVFVQLEDAARAEVKKKEERVKHFNSKFKSVRMDARKLQDIIKEKDERIDHLMGTVNPSKSPDCLIVMLILGDEVERLNKEKVETTKYHNYLWEVIRKKNDEINRLSNK
ncbi:hypothetical protein BDB01DRAFT_837178 [Pilobolus umbonatus]|nr:hypothetical protein BDB01DRAFT_837178 [Pilobolus umbonatus]